MNNEHNPMAVRIGNIQMLWEKTRQKNKQARLFALVSKSEDYPLVEGFFKLESSPYGKSPDTFVVFFMEFQGKEAFYHSLIQNWLDVFEEDLKKRPSWNWEDFPVLKEAFEKLDKNDEETLKLFYIKLLSSFKKFEGKQENLLIVSLIVKQVVATHKLHEAIKELHEALPKDVGLLLYDYKGRSLYDAVIQEEKGCFIEVPDQDISGAYQEIATQGDPNDPQVRFRKIVFEIGEAAKERNKKKVIRLGEELIAVSKKVGDLSFYASAYLIYGSFLFQFKSEKERIQELLDKGIAIVKPSYQNKKECAGVMLQLMMFKASHYSMIGESDVAIDAFMKHIGYAKELEEGIQVITGYNYVLLIAMKKERAVYQPILEEAFEYGYAMDDESLKIVNFTLIADHYLNKISVAPIKEKEIIERMESIYGENWQDSPKTIAKKMSQEYQLKA
ncbi:hypothetical protein [Tenacibaculum maritimum]|uniref:hypothetical protein n=1 Tax=Tenacibaculum maritimum TaxID=107401 RepID=UPI0012E559E0|nr:hypothetical protein [Tenacibaculum maritimum]MCD9582899.1 hypothetical protein [Tenacibaculum maritimum]MCD9637088.1 hypothetical protein [Tenacibaculum maritimum]CAA0244548.1 conserved hypothetical protein [Tenacibaculum maritimum]